MNTIDDAERRKFFAMMRQIQSDKELRSKVVADIRKIAADPTWREQRTAVLKNELLDDELSDAVSETE